MKKFSFIILSFLMMIAGVNSIKAADIVDDDVMSFFTATNPEDIRAITWRKLKTTDNQVVYCRDVERDWPTGSDGVNYSEEIDPMDSGLIYILENGYPNKTIVDGGDKDRYITQGAIWLYVTQSNTFENHFSDPDGLLPKMQELASAARASDVSTKVNSGVISDINLSSTEMNLVGDYYESELIKPEISGANSYKVSVSGANPASVVSESGEAKTDFNKGEGFKIRVPKTAGEDVSVTVNISIKTKAHMISPVGNDGYQRVIGLSNVDKDISESIVLKTSSKVCVDYVIVGNVKPDPALTDPTPEKTCYDKGTKYTQEGELTTKTNCKFNGWYTKDILTGKWIDGTNLNEDMTLYGAWDCPAVVNVPKTAANTPLIILGLGLISIVAGFGYYLVREKKAD